MKNYYFGSSNRTCLLFILHRFAVFSDRFARGSVGSLWNLRNPPYTSRKISYGSLLTSVSFFIHCRSCFSYVLSLHQRTKTEYASSCETKFIRNIPKVQNWCSYSIGVRYRCTVGYKCIYSTAWLHSCHVNLFLQTFCCTVVHLIACCQTSRGVLKTSKSGRVWLGELVTRVGLHCTASTVAFRFQRLIWAMVTWQINARRAGGRIVANLLGPDEQ